MNGRGSYVAGAAVLAVAMGFGRFAYTPMLVVMQRDAGLSVAATGVLASANLTGYLIGALLATQASVRSRRFAVICIAAVAGVLGTATMALSPAWWGSSRFVTGIASGLDFVLTVSLLLDRATRTQRTAGVAILFTGVGLGIVVAGALVPSVAAYGGSRITWLALAALGGAIVAFALPALGDEPLAIAGASAAVPSTRAGSYPLLVVAYGLQGAAYIIPATFLVAMVGESHGLARYSSLTWIVVGLAALPSAALWGALGRRIGVAPTWLVAMLAQGAGMLALWIPGVTGALVLAISLGFTFVGITFLTSALVRELRPNSTNVAFGLLTAVYGVGQIVGPLIAVRVALTTGHYRDALVVAAALLLVGTVVYGTSLVPAARGVRS